MIIQETIRVPKDDFETQMKLHERSGKLSTETIINYYKSCPKVDVEKMNQFATREF